MIEARKRAQLKRVKPGELVQGIAFSLITAHECFASAELLFDANYAARAFGLFINGVEEIGKANRFIETLLAWNAPEISETLKNRQKNHVWKISSAIEIFNKLTDSMRGELILKVYPRVKRSVDRTEPIEVLFHQLNPEAAELYHKMRISRAYTNFDGKVVKSPYYGFSELEFRKFKIANQVLERILSQLLHLADQYLSVLMKPIRKCYYCADERRAASLKHEIGRRIDRFLPALRKTFDDVLREHFGLTIDEFNEKKDSVEVFSKVTVKEFFKRAFDLVVSADEIPEIYFFPPLKDWAKEYYSKG